MAARTPDVKDIPSVGPGEYDVCKSVGHGPAYTMRKKFDGKVFFPQV
jgi:hypothetical protein